MTESELTGSVLGITDFGPVGGTPVVPPSYLTVYFLVFLTLLSVLYFYFYKKRQPTLLWQKVRLLIVLAFILKATILLGGTIVLAYWLVPTPGIRRTIPQINSLSFSPTNRIEIVFDRPINRSVLEKSIYPETPGRWVFENSLYTTHLYRKLVFYPTYSLRPDTNYTVKFSGIRNLINISPPYDYQFNFKTQTSPNIIAVEPVSGQHDVSTDAKIKVTLDNPNNGVSNFDFQFTPEIEYGTVFDKTKNTYTLIPKTNLSQGVQYNLKITKSDVLLNLEDGSVVERGASSDSYSGAFTIKEAPGINDFQPQGNSAPLESTVQISFSKEMDKSSVERNFSIEPSLQGKLTWVDNRTAIFKPAKLTFDTEYKITIAEGTKSVDGGFLEEDLVKSFRTIGNVKVSSTNPENELDGINIHTPTRISFDQEVDKVSAQQKFSLAPMTSGSFKWDGNTMIFTPERPLEFNTTYSVVIAKGVKSIKGRNSDEDFIFKFTTQNSTTKLAAPAYLQKYTLSCEIAALRMALNFRGVNVSEDDLIPQVGVDLTPHSGNIWGNPYKAFVGNIKGTQMRDGYGVYWAPIAKAARLYRNAQEFEGWNVEQLTNTIASGNPVVVWVYSHLGSKTSWNTPEGQYIYAVRDEHAVVAVGFVGPANNPSQIIINDPLSGQVYWSRTSFESKWNIFGRSGVVVY